MTGSSWGRMSSLPTGVWGRDPSCPLEPKEPDPTIAACGGFSSLESSSLFEVALLLLESGGLGVLFEGL